MRTLSPATVSAVFYPLALLVCVPAPLGAAPQATGQELPVSVERIREGLSEPPPLKLDKPLEVPVAKFKTRVDQRVYVLPFDEWLEKELKLTGLQRQSADWGAKCCGIGLDPLVRSVEDALQRRRERKIRDQIARELAELDAARKKAGLPDEK